ncbi:MAG TPA: FtsX-like permease family protein [Thermoleophilaceae bacterium]
MLATSLKGLTERKLRTFLTAFAVVLGVALISGTYILTDTISKTFDNVFTEVSKGIDVAVTPHKAFNDTNQGQNPPAFNAAILKQTQQVPGVQKAVGGVFDQASIIGKDGEKVGSNTTPNFVTNVEPEPFNAFNYVSGHAPTGPGEVALDKHTAADEGWKVGDKVKVLGHSAARTYTLVGIAKFGNLNSVAGAGIAVMTTPEAQKALDKVGRFDSVDIQAAPGVSADALAARVRADLPNTVTVRTGTEQARQDSQDVKDGFNFIKVLLLVFAGVALFVGAFMIFNAFSITIAQRTRELSMLRTLGASRRQVLNAVTGEALIVGFTASVIGLLAGLGLAPALKALFKAFGAELPSGGTVVETRTIVVSLLVGTLVTLVASLGPAVRATRISPIEGVREGAEIRGGRLARMKTPLAIGISVLGIALLAFGLFGGQSGGAALGPVGGGAALLFLGVALVSSRLVKPLSTVIGSPLERSFGVTGQIARENSVRNPGRTAGTAAALMIGLALVVFVTIFAAGIRHSIDDAIGKSVTAGLVVENKDGWSLIPESTGQAVAKVDGVSSVSPVRYSAAHAKGIGNLDGLSGIDPATFTPLFHVEWKKGSDAIASSLTDSGALASESWADSHNKKIGDQVTLQTQSGKEVPVTIKATYKNNVHALGDMVITNSLMGREFGQKQAQYIFVGLQQGANADQARAQATKVVSSQFPTAEVVTKDGFKDTQTKWVNGILSFFYVLLSLAVIVSLFGIVNTLVLAIYERTREIGMIRAVGGSRKQVKRIVRYESIITALIGATLGTVLGVFFAIIVSRPLASEGFSLSFPIATLIILLVLAALAGMVAAITPARRAAKLDVLKALAYE